LWILRPISRLLRLPCPAASHSGLRLCEAVRLRLAITSPHRIPHVCRPLNSPGSLAIFAAIRRALSPRSQRRYAPQSSVEEAFSRNGAFQCILPLSLLSLLVCTFSE